MGLLDDIKAYDARRDAASVMGVAIHNCFMAAEVISVHESIRWTIAGIVDHWCAAIDGAVAKVPRDCPEARLAAAIVPLLRGLAIEPPDSLMFVRYHVCLKAIDDTLTALRTWEAEQ